MRLLIVEDEADIRGALVRGFTKRSYAVDAAADGEEALECYYGARYDLVVLDLNLPKLDGLSVLRQIRDEDPQAKVIILSARGEIEDKIQGLDLGANDYLSKPFSFLELEARVRALLRREFMTGDSQVSFADVLLDTARKKAWQSGVEIALTPKEYGILEYLAVNRGRVVGTEEIYEHVWNNEASELTNSLKVHMGTLRKKLNGEVVMNMRGQGYYVE